MLQPASSPTPPPAKQLGVTVKPYRAATPDELDRALTALVSDRMDGMLNFQGGLSLSVRQVIVDFAAKHRLPAIYQATMFAKAGGLMSPQNRWRGLIAPAV